MIWKQRGGFVKKQDVKIPLVLYYKVHFSLKNVYEFVDKYCRYKSFFVLKSSRHWKHNYLCIYVCLCTFFVSTQSSCSNELMEVFSSPLPDPLSPQENASIGELGEWGNNCCMRYDRENQCPDFRSVFFFFSLIDPAAQYTGKTILFCILETGSYFPFPAGTIGEIK